MDTADGEDLADLLSLAAAQAEEDQQKNLQEDTDRTVIDTSDNFNDDDDSNSIAISKIKSSYMVLNEDDNALSDAPTSPTASKREERGREGTGGVIQAIPEIKPFQPGSMPPGRFKRASLRKMIDPIQHLTV